jgi:hypothetical protein
MKGKYQHPKLKQFGEWKSYFFGPWEMGIYLVFGIFKFRIPNSAFRI